MRSEELQQASLALVATAASSTAGDVSTAVALLESRPAAVARAEVVSSSK